MSERLLVGKDQLLKPRELYRYTWPALIASLGSIVIGLTDSLLISYYSTSALAGVALGAAVYELPINMLLGGLMAYRILAPRIHGYNTAHRETIGLAIVLKSLLPIAGLLTAITIASSVYGYYQFDDETWSHAFSYSAARAPSFVTVVASSAMSITLVVWGRTRIPLLVFLIAAPMNLLVDYVLIYGVGSAPELGALGAGIGSTISTMLPLPVLIALIMKNRSLVPDPTVAEHYKGWQKMTRPAVWSALVDYGGNIAFTMIIAVSGAAAVAGMRFGAQLHLLAFIVISSTSSAALYILGKEFPTQRNTIRKGTHELRHTFFTIGFIAGGVILLMSLAVSPVISPDPNVNSAFRVSAVIIAALCPVAGVTYANVTLLRLFGLTNHEFISNAVGVWCAQIPVALVLCLLSDGILPFIGLGAYWLFRCVLSHRQVTRYVQLTKEK